MNYEFFKVILNYSQPCNFGTQHKEFHLEKKCLKKKTIRNLM